MRKLLTQIKKKMYHCKELENKPKKQNKKKDKTLKHIFMEIHLNFQIQLPGVVPFRFQIIVILE